MSTNENIPASDERTRDTAPISTVGSNGAHDDAPEPDITKAGRNLILAMIVLTIGIGASQLFAGNLYKVALSKAEVERGGTVTTSAAGMALQASEERAKASGTVELEDGTKVNYVPVAEGAKLLLASPDALRGDAKYVEVAVEEGEIAQIPALPSFEAVLDPAAAAAAEEAAAQAAATEEAEEGEDDAADAAEDEAPDADAAE